jgi:putative transposase
MDALKQIDVGLTVPDACRELGISSATFYKRRAKYGGMDISMMVKMKDLEAENAQLKKMYIEEKLKAEILNDDMSWDFQKKLLKMMTTSS